MTVFNFKLIAMSTMLIDHTAYWFFDNNNIMRNIGRFAFIIYAFLIAESYYHLKDDAKRLKSHIIKLLLLCLISEFLYDQFTRCKWINWELQSVLPTLTLGFMALIGVGLWSQHNKHRSNIILIGSVVICFAAAIASYFFRSEFEFGGIILIVLFYLYLNKANDLTILQRIGVLLIIDAAYICSYIWANANYGLWPAIIESAESFNRRLIGSLIAVIPLAFYNRKLGYHTKWFNWLYNVFYPLQFVVMIIVRHFIRGF